MRLLHVTEIFPCPGKEWISQEAMDRGRWVHATTDRIDKALLRGVLGDEILRWRDELFITPGWGDTFRGWWGFVEAWESAKRDLGITVIASEEPVQDERRGYCGTRDKRVTMTGRRGEGVLDLKCCASCNGAIPETTGLQTAGYVGEAKLWRAAIALHPDGSYRWHDDRNNLEIFKPGDWREFTARLIVMQADINRGWREAPAPREE